MKEYLKKRSREDLSDKTNRNNYPYVSKKMRLDEVVKGIKDISKKRSETSVEKKPLPLREKSSIVKGISQEPFLKSKNNQNIGVSYFLENRLNSMSHIKQINPKFRNFIIPVLPSAFNKF